MQDKIIKVQGQLFFNYNLVNKNKNKWNENNPALQKYELHLGQLDEATVNRLEKELNVKVKTKSNDQYGIGTFIRCKSNFPFNAADVDGNPIDPLTIGNGSVCVVSLKSYQHAMSDAHGWSPQAIGGKTTAHITVKELIVKEPEEALQEDEVEL
jgi:hypothetical protein